MNRGCTDFLPPRTDPAPPEGGPEAHYDKGVLSLERGDLENAAGHFEAGAQQAPADERFPFSLAVARQRQGRSEEAIGLYQKTLAIDPNCAPACHNLGVLLLESDRLEPAAACLEKAVVLSPARAHFRNNLAVALAALGRNRPAAEHFSAAIRLDAEYAEAHFNFGRLRFSEKAWDEAAALFEKVLQLRPEHRGARRHLGVCRHAAGDPAAAAACYRRLLASDPTDPEAGLHLAQVLLDSDDAAQALEWCRRATAAAPERADILQGAGQMLERLGRFAEALAAMERALRLRPDAPGVRFNRAVLLLRMGRLAEAWPDYECRFKRPNWPQAYPHRIPKPRWDGSAFPGRTLLVHCEQGYGDTLQFARYLPLVKSRGGRVLLEVQPPLARLFKALPGADEVLSLSAERITDWPFDCYTPLLSLPELFGTTLDNVPANLPFIAPEPSRVSRWKERLGRDRFTVGIVWAGSTWHSNDKSRSCPLALFRPLAEQPGVHLVSLQKGKAAAEIDRLPPGVPLLNAGPELKDFQDTAELVAALDLVVTVDTAAAHLAAVMEKPVWVLLPFPADWRWRLEGADSPWYPTLRLFRQRCGGSWQEVFSSVAAAVESLRTERRSAPIVSGDRGRAADRRRSGPSPGMENPTS